MDVTFSASFILPGQADSGGSGVVASADCWWQPRSVEVQYNPGGVGYPTGEITDSPNVQGEIPAGKSAVWHNTFAGTEHVSQLADDTIVTPTLKLRFGRGRLSNWTVA